MTNEPDILKAEWAWLAGLVVLTAFVATYRLGADVGLNEHESLVAQTALEMRQSGDWVVPHFGGQPRLRKTPLPYWVVAGLSDITGRLDEWVARLPSAMSAIGTVICVWWLGRGLFGRRAGLVCGYVAACSAATFVYSHDASSDMELTFFCALCYALFYQGLTAGAGRERLAWFYGFYVSFGMGMLAKGPMPVVSVALPLLAYLLITRQWAVLRRMHLLGGVAVVLALLLPWVIAVLVRLPDAVSVWREQFVDRFTGEMAGTHESRWYVYLLMLFAFSVPWSLSVPEAVASIGLKRYAERRRAILYPWLWLVINIAFLMMAQVRRGHYLLPAFPALALLLGVVLDRLFFGVLRAGRRVVVLGSSAILLVVVVGEIAGGVWVQREIPGLLRDYVIAGGVGTVGVAAAVVAFLWRKRGPSFALLAATAVVLFCWLRPALGPLMDERARVASLVQAIQQQVPQDAELAWVARQDAPVLFYSGRAIARFDLPLPIVPQEFRARSAASGCIDEVITAVNWRCSQPEPIYLIANAATFARFRRQIDPAVRVIGSYPPDAEMDKQNVLFTNAPLPVSRQADVGT